jgi:hypothetical protein
MYTDQFGLTLRMFAVEANAEIDRTPRRRPSSRYSDVLLGEFRDEQPIAEVQFLKC